jgi:hypothetical protein
MSKTTTLAKPTLGGKTTSAAALAFAEAGGRKSPARSVDPIPPTARPSASHFSS